jgi:hypothetical protein
MADPSTTVYDLDYYSSSQMFLYIGDVWVDEVTSLRCDIQQNKTPLYGYASQLFDDTADGHVLVYGHFTINYKEAGYLWAVLRRYFNVTAANTGIKGAERDNIGKASRRTAPDLVNNKGEYVASNGTRISRASIERLVQNETTREENFKFYHDLASYATFDIKSPKDRVFEDIVEAFEDEIWQPGQDNHTLNSQIRRADHNKFDGFDMYLVFGDYSTPGANHTVEKIIGVRLQGKSKQVLVGGAPIQEQYNYIAQSIV